LVEIDIISYKGFFFFCVGEESIAMHKRKGFTLVELLVVIAIIALLLSILMPALGRVRQQSLAASCQVSLHQRALIFKMYTEDNNGFFHQEFEAKSTGWVPAYRPYYQPGMKAGGNPNEGKEQRKIRLCPAATKFWWDEAHNFTGNKFKANAAWGIFSGKTDDEGAWWAYKGDCGSFGLNGWVCNEGPEADEWWDEVDNLWRTPMVKGSANVPLFADCRWVDGWPRDTDEPPAYEGQIADDNWYITQAMKQFCTNRHDGNVQMLFMDSSVRKVGLKELWTLKWHRWFNTCGPWTRCGGVQYDDWPEWMRSFKEY